MIEKTLCKKDYKESGEKSQPLDKHLFCLSFFHLVRLPIIRYPIKSV